MKQSIFLSYPQPYNVVQTDFIVAITSYLDKRGFCARTLGVTDYDMEEPLIAIRKLMLESNGIITIAFKRYYIENGKSKYKSSDEKDISGQWLTSPYCHIEPAMAFQIGLPSLILREKGVLPDGILEKGVAGTYLPEFDLSRTSADYLQSDEWTEIISKWEGRVRKVIENKGFPPKLY